MMDCVILGSRRNKEEGNRVDFCHHLLRELISEVISRQLTLQRLVNGG